MSGYRRKLDRRTARFASTQLVQRMRPAAEDVADDVVWPALGFFVDTADVFTNDSEEKQQHTRKKGNQQQQRGEALRGLMKNDSFYHCVSPKKSGKADGKGAKQGGGADGHNGKGKNPVGGQPGQSEETILALTGMPFRTFDRYANLAVTHPTAKPAQVTMMLRQAADFVDHSPRHQAEISGVDRQPAIREFGHHSVEQEVAE